MGDVNDASGRDIMAPKSIFGRAGMRRRKLIAENILEREKDISSLSDFKMRPRHIPDSYEARPISRCCVSCLPEAEVMITDDFKHLGLTDCFIPPTMSSHQSLWCRVFSFYNYYFGTVRVASNLHQITAWKELQKDSNLFHLYGKTVDEQTKENVLAVLKTLQPKMVWNFMWSTFIRLSAWICQKYMSIRYFESVLVHEGQINLLKEVHKKKLPVIYIPTYKSDWDITLIWWVLAHHGLPTPFFIPRHDSSWKWLSGYYGGLGSTLKVSLDGDEEAKELMYSSAVSCYLRNLIRKKASIVFSLEAARSRTGTPSARVYGTELLKLLYEEYSSGKIEDAYFVPVSISYESLPDANEIFATNSPSNNIFKTALLNLFSLFNLKSNLKGNVKLDFSQPICLREFDKALKRNLKIQDANSSLVNNNDSYLQSRDCSFLRWGSSSSLVSVSSLYGELGPLYPGSDEPEIKTKALTLDVMNYHLVYDAGQCGSIMPVHLVAFVLMKKFRGKASFAHLLPELETLIKMYRKKRDFAFAIDETDMESIAYRGIQYLKDDVRCNWNANQQTYEILASTDSESLRRLHYMANFLLTDYLMEAIIATAIFSLIGPQLDTLRGFDVEISIPDGDLIHHCKRIYYIFASTFILHSPCLTTESAIRSKINEMSHSGRLSLEMRNTRNYQFEDEIDDTDEPNTCTQGATFAIDNGGFLIIPDAVKIPTSAESVDYMDFCRGLIIPYLEIYAFMFKCLKVFLTLEAATKKMEISKLEKFLLKELSQQGESQFKSYGHLLCLDTIKSFLATCEDREFIYASHGAGADPKVSTSYYTLAERYSKDGNLLDVQAANILHYVTK